MKSITEQTIEYFSATTSDFWKWGDNGTVIEWKDDNTTICYREDLMSVLDGLSPYGLPPIGSVLLLMAACQNRWKTSTGRIIAEGLAKYQPTILNKSLKDAISFLDMVNELPKVLRTGTNRVHLFQEIFKRENNIYVVLPIEVVDEMLSGRLDEAIFFKKVNESRTEYINKVRRVVLALIKPSRRFPDVASLEFAIRTGLKELPTPIDLIENEEEEEKSLLDQLKEDAKTEGIARLCQRVIAGLNIPMHSQGVSDQSFGGVSDITNRGDIDKLLLSELAYDDTTLMVRLANNEAMYLRREELPSDLHKERIILMDSTIKMWGVPRVFATSVGLACSIQDKNIASIRSYLLSGEDIHRIDLSTKEGVTKALEELHPELHCADAMHLFTEKYTTSDQTELILITDEQSLENEDFKKTLNEVRGSLTYLITINRQGRLHFYEYSLSGRRLISTTLYDLEELLFKTDRKMVISKSSIDDSVAKNLPLIYRHRPFPIYFPTPSIRFSQSNTFQFSDGAVAAITKDRRILFWKSRGLGAIELLSNIALNNVFEIAYFNNKVYVLEMGSDYVNEHDRHLTKVLKKWSAIDLFDSTQSFEVDYSGKEIFINHVKVIYGKFYLYTYQRETVVIDSDTGQIEPFGEEILFSPREKVVFPQVKKWVNNGYTTIRKAKRLNIKSDVDKTYGFSLNDWELKFTKNGLYFEQNNDLRMYFGQQYNFADDLSLKKGRTFFRKTMFPNGSYAIADSNGLLHLISTNPHLPIPQVTIPMIVGGAYTAAWASDGTVTGSHYFVNYSNPKRISPEEFYKKYIQPFLNEISRK